MPRGDGASGPGRPARPVGPGAGRRLAAITAVLVVGWLLAVYTIDPIRFVIFNPRGKTGFEVFLALGQLFGALVLSLSSPDADRGRIRWLASALMVLGIGALGFGYILPLFDASPDPNVSMYGSLAVRTTATILAAIGLVPSRPPELTRRTILALLLLGLAGTIAIDLLADALPRMVRATDMDALLATTARRSFPGLTAWHLGLGLVPLAAAIAACWGALAHVQGQAFGRWLAVALVLLAGAQLHALFWPSMYSSVLTTTSLLRLGLTAMIITGGIIELRNLSLERAALLAQEQERVRQLEELGQLKRDFTSMVAHELASPVAAIRTMAQVISLGALPPAGQQATADRIEGEARIIQLLIQDMRASTEVERDDFTVEARPVSLRDLLADAGAYGDHIRAGHHIVVEPPEETSVLADPARIGQVLRNLLNNAMRHTPEGTRITLRARREEGGVRIEVEDNGPGIDPADEGRIFEKFGRGRDSGEGRGLGLYLSRRILEAHGSDLSLASTPGHGACFGFLLKEAP